MHESSSLEHQKEIGLKLDWLSFFFLSSMILYPQYKTSIACIFFNLIF